MLDLWLAVRDVASEHVATVEVLADAYLGNRSEVELIDIDELAARLSAGTVVLLDVRPHVEFSSGHLPAAVSMPIAVLAERVSDFRRARSWPIAAGPTASTPMTPCDCCRRTGAPPPARCRCRGVAASGTPRRGVLLSPTP